MTLLIRSKCKDVRITWREEYICILKQMSVSFCPMIILQTVNWTEQKFFFHLGWLKKPPNLGKNCLDLCCSHCLSKLTYVWHWSVQWKTNWHTESGVWRCHYMMRSHNSFSKHISTATRTLRGMKVHADTLRDGRDDALHRRMAQNLIHFMLRYTCPFTCRSHQISLMLLKCLWWKPINNF